MTLLVDSLIIKILMTLEITIVIIIIMIMMIIIIIIIMIIVIIMRLPSPRSWRRAGSLLLLIQELVKITKSYS